MKYLRLFKTEAEYLAANKELPNVSYVKDTGNVYYNPKHAIDRSINAPLMNMMYALGYAENQNYMTYEEAARVTSLTAADFDTYEVVSAWELKYFTSLASFPYFDSGTHTIRELYIPDQIRRLGSSSLKTLSLVKLHLPEALTALPNYGLGASSDTNSILYIGSNIASNAPNATYANGWKTIISMSPAFTWSKTGTPAFQPTVYVPDEYVAGYQAVAPWTTWGTVKSLSEYTGSGIIE